MFIETRAQRLFFKLGILMFDAQSLRKLPGEVSNNQICARPLYAEQ